MTAAAPPPFFSAGAWSGKVVRREGQTLSEWVERYAEKNERYRRDFVTAAKA